MKEQIQALIEQCVIIKYHSNGLSYEAGFDKEKFAELIWDEAYQQGYEAGFDQGYETYRITE